jgi:acetyl esterase/lipase
MLGHQHGVSRTTVKRWSVGMVVIGLAASLLLSGCGAIGDRLGGGRASTTSEPPITPRTAPAETRLAVRYAQESPRQTLDLYLPAGDGSTVYPLVVLIHGGGFFSGDSTAMTDRAKFLGEKGFAAVSLNYRLTDDAPFPAGVQDVRAALRYLHANARSWGVDPQRMGVWGESAGGYLASMVGASNGDTRFDDPALGNAGASGRVAAVVSWFGPSDFSTMDAQARDTGCDASAQTHDRGDSPESRWLGAALPSVPDKVAASSVVAAVGSASTLPPYLLVHGERDCTVALGQSLELKDALEGKRTSVTLTVVPGAGHADPRISDEETRSTLDFLRRTLASA